jgi:hypothetical protein
MEGSSEEERRQVGAEWLKQRQAETAADNAWEKAEGTPRGEWLKRGDERDRKTAQAQEAWDQVTDAPSSVGSDFAAKMDKFQYDEEPQDFAADLAGLRQTTADAYAAGRNAFAEAGATEKELAGYEKLTGKWLQKVNKQAEAVKAAHAAVQSGRDELAELEANEPPEYEAPDEPEEPEYERPEDLEEPDAPEAPDRPEPGPEPTQDEYENDDGTPDVESFESDHADWEQRNADDEEEYDRAYAEYEEEYAAYEKEHREYEEAYDRMEADNKKLEADHKATLKAWEKETAAGEKGYEKAVEKHEKDKEKLEDRLSKYEDKFRDAGDELDGVLSEAADDVNDHATELRDAIHERIDAEAEADEEPGEEEEDEEPEEEDEDEEPEAPRDGRGQPTLFHRGDT